MNLLSEVASGIVPPLTTNLLLTLSEELRAVSDLDVGAVQLQCLAGIQESIAIGLCFQVSKTSVAVKCSYSRVQVYGLAVVLNGSIIPLLCGEMFTKR